MFVLPLLSSSFGCFQAADSCVICVLYFNLRRIFANFGGTTRKLLWNSSVSVSYFSGPQIRTWFPYFSCKVNFLFRPASWLTSVFYSPAWQCTVLLSKKGRWISCECFFFKTEHPRWAVVIQTRQRLLPGNGLLKKNILFTVNNWTWKWQKMGKKYFRRWLSKWKITIK